MTQSFANTPGALRTAIGMIESFSLFMVWKNFMRACFVKKQKRNPKSNAESPAMRVGIETRILGFFEVFETRLQKSQAKLNEDWEQYVDRINPYDRYTRLS